jgi:hypothetical protein
MKPRTLVIGAAVAVFLLLAAYVSQNSSTPPGQERLATLTAANFASFEETFDKSPEGARMLLLLSPT